jgi:proline iminopeptidase
MMPFARRLSRLLAVSVGAYGIVARPRLLRWGATDEELLAPFPGADLIPDGKRHATMAITVDAPVSRVWPWLVQMGCDRAGWYSWDHLDNGGVASAKQIHPEWQDVSVGDRLGSSPSGSAWFVIAAVEPDRFLALRAALDLRGHPFDASGPRPRFFSDSVWAFLLEEQPGERTRLVVSGYACSSPRFMTAIGDWLFWEPAHWIMQARQFSNLKRRAERSADRAADSPTRLTRVRTATRLTLDPAILTDEF